MGVIYLITNKLNGMQYVGQTIQPLNVRISGHKHGNLYIDKAIRKYGWENFLVEVLEECDTLEQLNDREKYWIASLNCRFPNGYNRTGGGRNAITLKISKQGLSEIQSKTENSEKPRYYFDKIPEYDTFHPAISLALKFIEEHCHEDISQPVVADAVCLNSSYFSSLFKKSLGVGFSEYLTELRIAHVKERLVTSSEKIKAVATSEGYDDYQYFCKLFKRLTGLKPGEYRLSFTK